MNPTSDGHAVLDKPAILHVCQREMLRPLRDQILRLSGFEVESTHNPAEGLSMFGTRSYDLVLIDVEGEGSIDGAEILCTEIRTAQPQQLVAFVCNWRVAALTDCPDEIVRTEFNPEAFIAGVRKVVRKQETNDLETDEGVAPSKSGDGTLP